MTDDRRKSLPPRTQDFIIVDPRDDERWAGVVVDEIWNGDEIFSYVVQPWDHNGPLNTQVTVHAADTEIHPDGRLTVLDDIKRKKFNNR